MPEPLLLVAAGLLAVAALTWLVPHLLRPVWRLLVHGLYRFRVYDRENVPATGGCLIICNHVTYLDRLVLRAACPRRLVFAATVQHAAESLDAGRAVVIFPEGRLTRSGHLLPFGSDIETILRLAKVDVPVIPACTDGLWGTQLSYERGRILWKWPRACRPPVAVMFGQRIGEPSGASRRVDERVADTPGDSRLSARQHLSASEIRLAVQELGADCAIRQSDGVPLVHRVFVRNAVKFRNLFRTCVIDNAAGEKILTWGKTFVAAMCVTRYLRKHVGEAQNVGVWLPTGLGAALSNLAIAFLGKTSVNLNYTAGPDVLKSCARQAGLRVVITSKRFLMRFPLDLPDDIQRIYLEDVLGSVTKGQQIRTFLMAVLLPGWFIERCVLGLHRHKPDDVLTIVFSSGSTGEPKGVVLTHRNIGSNVHSSVRTIHIRRSDTLFGVLPMFHSFGYTVCLWAPLVAEATALYHPDPRGAKEVGALAKKHKATLFLSTATFLRFYIRRCEADDFRSLRILICGAEKLPVKLQHEFHAKFGLMPLEGYGCTELSPVVSTNLPDEHGERCNEPGTVGQPIIGVCVKAFTQEGRVPLPTGVEGVLCCKGPNVMAGYLDQPEKTAEAIKDGWYWTGDVGLVQPNGFIRITGRVSRFAKIAGEMVPLERVEEEMLEVYGGGERVLVVAAVADEKRGERLVVLYIEEAHGKLGELLDALPGRGLPNLWVPDARDCHRVEALPLLGSGKLDLKRVGELAKQLTEN